MIIQNFTDDLIGEHISLLHNFADLDVVNWVIVGAELKVSAH
jgi:hypothetical protein